MVSLGDLAPPEKPTGRRYLTGRPDGQEAVWRNPRRYLVPKPSKGEPPHGKKATRKRRRVLYARRVFQRAPVETAMAMLWVSETDGGTNRESIAILLEVPRPLRTRILR